MFSSVVMFFRFVTSAEIQKRSEFFEQFIMGLSNTTVEQVGFNAQNFFSSLHKLLVKLGSDKKETVEPLVLL
jgi:hypothetical protein